MMEQVAGRAGRKSRQGTVILQTAQPQHPVIAQIMRHDYAGMYATQIAERQQFNYPPFIPAYLHLSQTSRRSDSRCAAKNYAQRLYPVFGHRLSDPHTPPVARIQLLYIRRIMLKIEHTASLKKVREILRQIQDSVTDDPLLRCSHRLLRRRPAINPIS